MAASIRNIKMGKFNFFLQKRKYEKSIPLRHDAINSASLGVLFVMF